MSAVLALISDSKMNNLFEIMREKMKRSGGSGNVSVCELTFLKDSVYLSVESYTLDNYGVWCDGLLHTKTVSMACSETKESVYGAVVGAFERLFDVYQYLKPSDSIIVVLRFLSDFAFGLIHGIAYLIRCEMNERTVSNYVLGLNV